MTKIDVFILSSSKVSIFFLTSYYTANLQCILHAIYCALHTFNLLQEETNNQHQVDLELMFYKEEVFKIEIDLGG
ncbi:MAG TPA: hypothetical protein DIS65_00345 [Candidatus Marinimicrobia bacterium]|nr:hypothetical protein [Candidatus Neomarinimicrobiota bacterium]